MTSFENHLKFILHLIINFKIYISLPKNTDSGKIRGHAKRIFCTISSTILRITQLKRNQ